MLFEGFSPIELATLSEVTAIILADNLDVDDLNVLGAFITTVGDSIALMAAQKEYLESNSSKK